MFNWLFGNRKMWQFETLVDFGCVVRWMEKQRRKGKENLAFRTFFRNGTALMRTNVDRYEQCVEDVNRIFGGIYTAPGSAAGQGVSRDPNISILNDLKATGEALRQELDGMLDLSDDRLTGLWLEMLKEKGRYIDFLSRLVGNYGRFEALLPMLPGTGEMISAPGTQNVLAEMYHINTTNLRLLEMISRTYKAWRSIPPESSRAFFNPACSVKKMVTEMILEYMLEADPKRINAKRAIAAKANRPYQAYRFWRAAEILRLMANIKYVDGRKRRPVPKRRFLKLQLGHSPALCVDSHRLEWSLKEICNNSLSAVASVYVESNGKCIAEPLDRHSGPSPSHAIRFSLETDAARRKPVVRLLINDEGVGIPAEHVPNVTMWAYSPRREKMKREAEEASMTGENLRNEIRIGGKGIGLAYASTVIREHGGTIDITSQEGYGTKVVIELPIPSPLEV